MRPLKTTLLISCIIVFTKVLYAQTSFGVTVFGTEKVTEIEITNSYGDKLEALIAMYEEDRDRYYSEKELLDDELLSLGDFAYAHIFLFKSYVGDVDYIIDFVESKDAATRLNYRKMDSLRNFDDPQQLIERWQEYEDLSFELFNKGEINDMSCPVIHCIWSFNHPKLELYLSIFNEGASQNRERLITILNTSDSANQRAAASFLLAHSGLSNQDLVNVLLPSIKDPERNVRNNSMRVIYYIARAEPDIDINIDDVLDALDFPSFTDRNKALVILRSLPLQSLSPKQNDRLISILIEILRKKDAHNYKNAHTILQKMSGKDFDSDDIQSWENWAGAYLK